MKPAFIRCLIWDIGASILMLLLPLLIFLKHHNYPLTQPETLLVLFLVIPGGLLCGLLMSLGQTPGRLVVTVLLAVLLVDIQTDWITTWGLRLLLNLLGFSALFWFLRRRLSQVVLVVAGAMVLGTLVTPGRPQVREDGWDLKQPAAESDLPFILHIILDEHLGIEGIPRQFDADRSVAAQVRDTYLNLGFRVFGRAYSSYYSTRNSVPNLLNFTTSDDPKAYGVPATHENWHLEENAWFEYLRDQGYWIHVLQQDYLTYDVANPALDGQASSVTFDAESIFALGPVDMPAATKAGFILGSFVRLSYFLGKMRDAYGNLRRSALGGPLELPAWDEAGDKLSTMSSMNALRVLERDLEHAAPGRAFFVHLLVPHSPYIYQRDCGIREVESAWLVNIDPDAAPNINDPVSRAQRYPLYLDQLICTTSRMEALLEGLSGRPWWEDAMVVIHGDHGSRLDLVAPFQDHKRDFTPQGLMDSFSTFFAVKTSFLAAGYDRRQLPLGHLHRTIMKEKTDPGNPDLESRPRVMIWDESNPMQEVDLPIFDHGLPGTDTDQGS